MRKLIKKIISGYFLVVQLNIFLLTVCVNLLKNYFSFIIFKTLNDIMYRYKYIINLQSTDYQYTNTYEFEM